MKNFLVKAFICVESALFLAFTVMDVLDAGDSRWLKFAGIALCFVVSALLSARGGEVLVTAAVGLSAAADILLFDPEEVWTVDPDRLHSKSRNTPFKGMKLTGRVRVTLLGGRIVWQVK